MEIKNYSEKKINKAFEALGQIQEVKVSSSFKQNVLHKILEKEQEQEDISIQWFTPKLQLAAMIVVLLVNASAIVYSFSSSSSSVSSLDSFAQEYNLTSSESIIN